jgi:hypothetical protein
MTMLRSSLAIFHIVDKIQSSRSSHHGLEHDFGCLDDGGSLVPQLMTLTLRVVKSDPKIIISLLD